MLAGLVAAGLWLRTLQPMNLAAAVAWPWMSPTVVTLYFLDGDSERTRPPDGPILFPVSRRVPRDADLPRAAIEALLAGPPASRLKSALPAGVASRETADGTNWRRENSTQCGGDKASGGTRLPLHIRRAG